MRPTVGAARLRGMRRRLSLLRERVVRSGGTSTGFVMLVIVLLMFGRIRDACLPPPVRA